MAALRRVCRPTSRGPAILSVCISDWTAPRTQGTDKGRSAAEFRRGDVPAVIWEQVKEALAGRPEYQIHDSALAFSYSTRTSGTCESR